MIPPGRDSKSKKSGKSGSGEAWPLVKAFWHAVWDCEGGLLSRGLAREGTALHLLAKQLERITELVERNQVPDDDSDAAASHAVTALLGPHTVACLASCRSRSKQKLKEAADEALSQLEATARRGPLTATAMATALLSHFGPDFDSKTHSNILNTCLKLAGSDLSRRVLEDGVQRAISAAVSACDAAGEKEAVEDAEAASHIQKRMETACAKAAQRISDSLILAG